MKLNVHELINMPGYGKANEAVQKAGKWGPGPIERLQHALAAARNAVLEAKNAIEDAYDEMREIEETNT